MLVSVVVITYNSATTVVETLDSIYRQTYPNIELLISDDGSGDATTSLVESWLEKNGKRFANAKLLKAEKNQGIVPNCNKGARVAKGEWFKLIAGDDLLLPDCLTQLSSFIARNPEAHAVVSKIAFFKKDPQHAHFIWPVRPFPTTIKDQLKEQLVGSFINAPGVFLRTATLARFGYFDERYPFLEDFPLWIKFLNSGLQFYFLPEVLVAYRVHDTSISHSRGEGFKRFFDSLSRYKKDTVWGLMLKNRMYLQYFISKTETRILANRIKKYSEGKELPWMQQLILKIIYRYTNLVSKK